MEEGISLFAVLYLVAFLVAVVIKPPGK